MQEKVGDYWENPSEGGDEKAQMCGWLKDKYGVPWQIIPSALPDMLQDEDYEKSQRVMKAMLQMKKIDNEALKLAYKGQGTKRQKTNNRRKQEIDLTNDPAANNNLPIIPKSTGFCVLGMLYLPIILFLAPCTYLGTK